MHFLTGLVLCGGQSLRMGTDKGLLQSGGKTWAQDTADKISALQLPVLISVHPSQQDRYITVFPENQLITDSLPLRGPLAGLLTAHQYQPHNDWLVCACDLPHMTISILQQLQQAYTDFSEYDCFVFRNQGEWEPLCGIYTAKSLQKIKKLYDENNLPRQSMKFVLETCHTYTLEIADDATRKAFKNCNTPEDKNEDLTEK